MAKYRKKPVVIEATQWFKNGDHPLDYSKEHGGLENVEFRVFSAAERKLNPGVKGEMYPCKPDIFAATYEAIP